MKRVISFPALIALSMATLSAEVQAAGSIKGVVNLQGPAPAKTTRAITKDGIACGKDVPNESVIVGAGNSLANVVVSLVGIKPRTPPASPSTAVIDQVGCRYQPHVQTVEVGATLGLRNSDAVFHNVHANLMGPGAAITVFNLAMPFKGQKTPVKVKKPGIMRLQCDAGHTWMNAYVVAFAHPFHAVTDAQGRFAIQNVEPGEHTIEFWHEPLDDKGQGFRKTLPVTIVDGQATTLTIDLRL